MGVYEQWFLDLYPTKGSFLFLEFVPLFRSVRASNGDITAWLLQTQRRDKNAMGPEMPSTTAWPRMMGRRKLAKVKTRFIMTNALRPG